MVRKTSLGMVALLLITSLAIPVGAEPPAVFVADDVALTVLEDTDMDTEANAIPFSSFKPDLDDWTGATVEVLAGPTDGSIRAAGDDFSYDTGTAFEYGPDEDFYGTDSILVKWTLGADSDFATITVTVTPVDDEAVFEFEPASVDEDSFLAYSAVDLFVAFDDETDDVIAEDILSVEISAAEQDWESNIPLVFAEGEFGIDLGDNEDLADFNGDFDVIVTYQTDGTTAPGVGDLTQAFTFTQTIDPVADDANLDDLAAQSVAEGGTYVITWGDIVAALDDPDDREITGMSADAADLNNLQQADGADVTANTADDTFTLLLNGEISDEFGEFEVTFTFTPSEGPDFEVSYPLTITPVNDIPEALAGDTATEDTVFSLSNTEALALFDDSKDEVSAISVQQIRADPAGDNVAFTQEGDNFNLDLATAFPNFNGDMLVQVHILADGLSSPADESTVQIISFTLDVEAVLDMGALDFGTLAATEDGIFTWDEADATYTDAADDVGDSEANTDVVYSSARLVVGESSYALSETDGVWTIDLSSDFEDYYGPIQFDVTVTPAGEDPEVHSATLSVSPVNDAPVLIADPEDLENTVAWETNWTVDPTDLVYDVDDDDLTFTVLSGLGDHAFGLNETTGEIYFNATTAFEGDVDLAIEVSDGNGGLLYFFLTFHVHDDDDDPPQWWEENTFHGTWAHEGEGSYLVWGRDWTQWTYSDPEGQGILDMEIGHFTLGDNAGEVESLGGYYNQFNVTPTSYEADWMNFTIDIHDATGEVTVLEFEIEMVYDPAPVCDWPLEFPEFFIGQETALPFSMFCSDENFGEDNYWSYHTHGDVDSWRDDDYVYLTPNEAEFEIAVYLNDDHNGDGYHHDLTATVPIEIVSLSLRGADDLVAGERNGRSVSDRVSVSLRLAEDLEFGGSLLLVPQEVDDLTADRRGNCFDEGEAVEGGYLGLSRGEATIREGRSTARLSTSIIGCNDDDAEDRGTVYYDLILRINEDGGGLEKDRFIGPRYLEVNLNDAAGFPEGIPVTLIDDDSPGITMKHGRTMLENWEDTIVFDTSRRADTERFRMTLDDAHHGEFGDFSIYFDHDGGNMVEGRSARDCAEDVDFVVRGTGDVDERRANRAHSISVIACEDAEPGFYLIGFGVDGDVPEGYGGEFFVFEMFVHNGEEQD